MRGIILYAKVLGLILLMSFSPILSIGFGLSKLSFWPFPFLQTLALILVGGSLLTWYMMQTCYEHNILSWTFSPSSNPQWMRLLISFPPRKPYVLFQIWQGTHWITNDRCDFTGQPLSTADQEKLTTFLEGIPNLGNQQAEKAFDYIHDQFSHEPLIQVYIAISGKTKNKI